MLRSLLPCFLALIYRLSIWTFVVVSFLGTESVPYAVVTFAVVSALFLWACLSDPGYLNQCPSKYAKVGSEPLRSFNEEDESVNIRSNSVGTEGDSILSFSDPGDVEPTGVLSSCGLPDGVVSIDWAPQIHSVDPLCDFWSDHSKSKDYSSLSAQMDVELLDVSDEDIKISSKLTKVKKTNVEKKIKHEHEGNRGVPYRCGISQKGSKYFFSRLRCATSNSTLRHKLARSYQSRFKHIKHSFWRQYTPKICRSRNFNYRAQPFMNRQHFDDEITLKIKPCAESKLDRSIFQLTADGLIQSGIKLKFCGTCCMYQPIRTKHCRDCGRCVRTYDHHCPWIGNCVGEGNRRIFYWFLVTEFIEISWITLKTYNALISYLVESEWMVFGTFLMILIFSLVLMLLMISCLLIYHTYLVLSNFTTWERMAWDRVTYLRVCVV